MQLRFLFSSSGGESRPAETSVRLLGRLKKRIAHVLILYIRIPRSCLPILLNGISPFLLEVNFIVVVSNLVRDAAVVPPGAAFSH